LMTIVGRELFCQALSLDGGTAMALLGDDVSSSGGGNASASLGAVWSIHDFPSLVIAIRFPSISHKYGWVDGNDQNIIKLTADHVNAHEKFTIVKGNGPNRVQLRSHRSGKYCGDAGHTGVMCDQPSPGGGNAQYEFNPISNQGGRDQKNRISGRFTMKSSHNGLYCQHKDNRIKCLSGNPVGRCWLTLL
jgi:hypothetical protein